MWNSPSDALVIPHTEIGVHSSSLHKAYGLGFRFNAFESPYPRARTVQVIHVHTSCDKNEMKTSRVVSNHSKSGIVVLLTNALYRHLTQLRGVDQGNMQILPASRSSTIVHCSLFMYVLTCTENLSLGK